MGDFRNSFTDQRKAVLRRAIEVAEMDTSGEIRAHIENRCPEEPMDRAAFIFGKLGMHKTGLRNGVLFYLAVKDKKFVILGDAGINAVVPSGFWDNISEVMLLHFREDKIAEGLAEGIRMAGVQLKSHFPWQKGDINELTDDISFGDDVDTK
jgi:hypothetical protein